ncbi:MAG: MoxR family ATPase [Vampirovibrionales bacterium]|nr:MoxR family ATPase [Vampirovibrionales bacterium]
MSDTNPNTKNGKLSSTRQLADKLREKLGEIIFGQPQTIDALLIALLAEGHVLLEGLPGTAKTTLVKSLAQLIESDFKRVQLTPDMLPAEIIGTSIYDLNARSFSFQPGPVFSDILLADEINRTPPKTQSALLEAMEEHQVTIDGNRHPLGELFTVIATLNPVEFEGTYPLPEAQLDRFMMKVIVDYPDKGAEQKMLREFSKHPSLRYTHQLQLTPITSKAELLAARRSLSLVRVDEALLDYALEIIRDTRQNPNLELGASPRSALSLVAAARAKAAIDGQDFVTPDHIKAMTPLVLNHRVVLSAEAELDGLDTAHVLKQTLGKIPIPR